MTLDELRNLDPKEAGNWPMAVQLASAVLVFVLVMIGAYFVVWQDQLQTLSVAQEQEEKLKQEFVEKKKKAVNLAAYRQQLIEIQQAFGVMLKQLPNKAEMETLLTEINQAGVGRGLLFELFKPGAEIKGSEFVEQPIDIKVSGNYHDLASFVSDVGKLSRIVTTGDIQLTPQKDASLTMVAKVRTYRVLDEAEIQAARQAEAEARKKKKP
jgi:type IV pilus assembly protein PilO